jgi:hypothetical protein
VLLLLSTALRVRFLLHRADQVPGRLWHVSATTARPLGKNGLVRRRNERPSTAPAAATAATPAADHATPIDAPSQAATEPFEPWPDDAACNLAATATATMALAEATATAVSAALASVACGAQLQRDPDGGMHRRQRARRL